MLLTPLIYSKEFLSLISLISFLPLVKAELSQHDKTIIGITIPLGVLSILLWMLYYQFRRRTRSICLNQGLECSFYRSDFHQDIDLTVIRNSVRDEAIDSEQSSLNRNNRSLSCQCYRKVSSEAIMLGLTIISTIATIVIPIVLELRK